MLRIIVAVMLFIPGVTFGATIYIDNTLKTNCTSSNYSIVNRNCTGNAGNAYNNILAAQNASVAGDTIYFRTGSHSSNVGGQEGILPKANQVWRTYPGDMPNRASISATQMRVFTGWQVNGVTLADLVMTGGTEGCIWWGNSQNLTVHNNDCSAWNTGAGDFKHGFYFGGFPNLGSVNTVVTNNYVRAPKAHGPNRFNAGIAGGERDSNALVRGNIVEGVAHGIWFDVGGGDPRFGKIPHTIEQNIIINSSDYCFHLEVGSTAVIRNNVAYGCSTAGVFIRPGGSGMDGIKVQNNTFYGTNPSIYVIRDASAGIVNSNFDNNIIVATGSPSQHLITVGNTSTGATNTWRNNLIYAPGNSNGICWNKPTGSGLGCDGTSYADTSAGITSWRGVAATATGNIAGDPLFVNVGAGNFNLQSGSPAINAGINVGLPYNGTAPDIGALESGSVTSPPPPPPPPPFLAIPGRIEAESFNTGGEGVAYHDTTSANLEGAYRTSEAVDIKLSSGGVGYSIGYIDTGEWLKYDVNVGQSGNYTITVRAANGASTNGGFRIEVDGVNATGTISIPPTGSYGTETTVTGPTISLAQGAHTLRVFMEAANFDLNWIEFTAISVGSPPAAPGNLVVGIQ